MMEGFESLPLTSSHWGTYRVETRAGKVTALHGFEQDTEPSAIGHGIVDVLDGGGFLNRPGWSRRNGSAPATGYIHCT